MTCAPGDDPVQTHPCCIPLPRLHATPYPKYDFTIEYRPSKDMILTHHLSQFLSLQGNLPIELHHNIQHIHISSDRLNIIQEAVEGDPIHNTLYCLTLNGWPDHIHQVPQISQQLWDTQNELSIECGILFKVDHICISLNYAAKHWQTYIKATTTPKSTDQCNNLLNWYGHQYWRLCKRIYTIQ